MRLSKLASLAGKLRAMTALVACVGLMFGGVYATHHAAATHPAASDDRGLDPDGKGEKKFTGLSFEKQTRVDRYPFPSTAATSLDSERVWSGYDDWEPAIAIHPTNPNIVYQLTTRYNGPKACNGCPLPVIVMRTSTDGGNTWGPDRFIPNAKKSQNDPEIAVATDGTIYMAWMDGYTPGVAFAKSSNGGATWTPAIHFAPPGTKFTDKPILLISPNGQYVYVGFNSSDNYVATSSNYGANFTISGKLNNDTRYWFHTGGAVAPNGDVYFITSDFTQDYTGDANIKVMRSTNHGASWTITLVDTSKQMPDCPWSAGCKLGFFGTIAGLAIDPVGKVMIAYNANNTASAPMQMYARSSTDGVTWSARQDLGAGLAYNHCNVAVAAGNVSGSFAIVWQDDRNGVNTAFNAWMRTTTTGGGSWNPAQRLSDQATGAPYKTAAGHKFPYGDYLEVQADSTGQYHAIWGEGISYTGPGGTWYTRTH